MLLANEPRAYRETLAAALRVVRPNLEVRVVAPDDLEAALHACTPVMVISSTLSSMLAGRTGRWLLLYPDGARLVVHGQENTLVMTGDLELEQLLATIDRALG